MFQELTVIFVCWVWFYYNFLLLSIQNFRNFGEFSNLIYFEPHLIAKGWIRQ